MLKIESSPSTLAVFASKFDAPVVTQNAAPNKRPFIHPLLAPDGIGELTENEPGHHLWQHGLYIGLNDVNGVGFWTEGLSGNPLDGSFHPHQLSHIGSADPQSANWEVVTDWRNHTGTRLLTETQSWNLTWREDYYFLDLDWKLTAAFDLKFGQSAYGGLFLRMPFRSHLGGEAVNSQGAINQDAERQKARWMLVTMPIAGRPVASPTAGIAIFDHPSNPLHPVPWRVDGELGIAPSRCIESGWSLSARESTTSRYRVLVFSGTRTAAQLENDWKEFSESRLTTI